ncbi:hypothetical protein PMAYCL1PPCAC_32892, partial [Pristionchus mayeri]
MEDPANPPYLWMISGPFYSAYSSLMCGISLMTNFALILAVIFSKSSEIRSYGYLLVCFALSAMFTSIMQVISLPHLHLTSTDFWLMPRNDGIFWSKGGIVALITSFMYIASRSRFDGFRTVHWVILGISVFVLTTVALIGVGAYALVPSDYSRSIAPTFFVDLYDFDATDPDMGILHLALKRFDATLQWHGPNLVALGVGGFVLSASAAVILICICLIYFNMRNFEFVAKTRTLQRQLYRVLLIQSAVFSVFVFIPMAIMTLLPLTGANLGSFGTILIMIPAIQPSINALLIILMVPFFRSTILHLLRVLVEAKSTFYIANNAKIAPE